MKFKDSLGNELKEGTKVSLGVQFGASIAGEIVKLESGLGPNGPSAQPMAYASFVMPLQVHPNGTVLGIFCIAEPKPELTTNT